MLRERLDPYDDTAEPYDLPENILVLRNPVSTRADQARHKISHLQEYGAEHGVRQVEIIETTAESREDNKERFAGAIERKLNQGWSENMAVAIAGGDGTIGMAAEALLESSHAVRTVPMLPIGAGFINDVAGMLHTRYARKLPVRMLGTSQKVAVRPLQCRLETEQGTDHKTAIGYITFGATANACQEINKVRIPRDERTAMRQLVQPFRVGRAALQSVLRAKLFNIHLPDTRVPIGERHQTNLDMLMINGHRLAGALKAPVRLDEDRFFVSRVPTKHTSKLIGTAVRFLAGRPEGDYHTGAFSFETGTAMMLQVDGEPYAIEKDTLVTVQQAENALSFISLGHRF